ncbi:MAG: efflux RND transporter periplasmic adaptor subunit [Psychrobacter sp.]|nr:efflux RND transporter periplasmic adaptor subunit [Psychrobacter sp.]
MSQSPDDPKLTHISQSKPQKVLIKPDVDPLSTATPPYRQTMPNSQRWKWLLPLMIVTLGIGLLAGKIWGQKQAQEQLTAGNTATTERAGQTSVSPQMATATGVTEVPVNTKPVLTVEVVTPQQSVIENALSADGTIVPKDIATVFGKVSGVTIDKVMAREGQQVKQGQVLALFDTEAMQQQRTQAQADLAEAQTRLTLARADADRVIPLLDIDAVSKQEVDRYIATANQAAASVEAAKARLNNQTLNLNNAQVVAPVSGVISEKTANVGSVPGQEPLFTIIENGTLEWQAQVDPNKLGGINVGTPVKVDLPNNKSVIGQVSRIAPTAEKGSRQVSIFATLANSPDVRAGMYQRGTFVLGREGKQILPISAVVTEDGYDYLMLVNQEKDAGGNTVYRIKKRKVALGERQGDQVVVTEPLPKDVAIVRQGGSFLNDGDIVRIAGADSTDKQAAATPKKVG